MASDVKQYYRNITDSSGLYLTDAVVVLESRTCSQIELKSGFYRLGFGKWGLGLEFWGLDFDLCYIFWGNIIIVSV